MLRYQGEAEDHGAALALRTRLRRGGGDGRAGSPSPPRAAARRCGSWRARWSTPPGSSPARWRRRPSGWRRSTRRAIFYCKGNYFSVAARVPFRHLVYPVPERDGLGRAPDPRHGRAGPLRAGHRVDRRHRLQPRRPPRRGLLRGDPQLLAGSPRRRRSPRATPASAPSSSPRAGRPPTSPSRGRRCTGWPGSSTSTASRAPASPPRSPSPTRWRRGSGTEQRRLRQRLRMVYTARISQAEMVVVTATTRLCQTMPHRRPSACRRAGGVARRRAGGRGPGGGRGAADRSGGPPLVELLAEGSFASRASSRPRRAGQQERAGLDHGRRLRTSTSRFTGASMHTSATHGCTRLRQAKSRTHVACRLPGIRRRA